MCRRSSGREATLRGTRGGLKLFFCGVDRKRNGVGATFKEEFVISVVKVKRVSERIMTLPDIKRSILNVVSVRVPEVLEEKGIVN